MRVFVTLLVSSPVKRSSTATSVGVELFGGVDRRGDQFMLIRPTRAALGVGLVTSSANGDPLILTACAWSKVMGSDRFDHIACKTSTLDHDTAYGNGNFSNNNNNNNNNKHAGTQTRQRLKETLYNLAAKETPDTQ